MSSNTLCIRFIRANQSGETDDRVLIRPLSLKLYSLTYIYGESVSQSYDVVLSDSTVFRYIQNLIDLYSSDADPFESLQFDFPLMPSILIRVDELDTAGRAILEAVDFHLDHMTPSPSAKIARAIKLKNDIRQSDTYVNRMPLNRHLIFDE
jgi:hypothetical protein